MQQYSYNYSHNNNTASHPHHHPSVTTTTTSTTTATTANNSHNNNNNNDNQQIQTFEKEQEESSSPIPLLTYSAFSPLQQQLQSQFHQKKKKSTNLPSQLFSLLPKQPMYRPQQHIQEYKLPIFLICSNCTKAVITHPTSLPHPGNDSTPLSSSSDSPMGMSDYSQQYQNSQYSQNSQNSQNYRHPHHHNNNSSYTQSSSSHIAPNLNIPQCTCSPSEQRISSPLTQFYPHPHPPLSQHQQQQEYQQHQQQTENHPFSSSSSSSTAINFINPNPFSLQESHQQPYESVFPIHSSKRRAPNPSAPSEDNSTISTDEEDFFTKPTHRPYCLPQPLQKQQQQQQPQPPSQSQLHQTLYQSPTSLTLPQNSNAFQEVSLFDPAFSFLPNPTIPVHPSSASQLLLQQAQQQTQQIEPQPQLSSHIITPPSTQQDVIIDTPYSRLNPNPNNSSSNPLSSSRHNIQPHLDTRSPSNHFNQPQSTNVTMYHNIHNNTSQDMNNSSGTIMNGNNGDDDMGMGEDNMMSQQRQQLQHISRPGYPHIHNPYQDQLNAHPIVQPQPNNGIPSHIIYQHYQNFQL